MLPLRPASGRGLPRPQAGVYQMGEVKARSWCTCGTFAGIVSLNRTWS
jgi:hypothetical protein